VFEVLSLLHESLSLWLMISLYVLKDHSRHLDSCLLSPDEFKCNILSLFALFLVSTISFLSFFAAKCSMNR